MQLQALSRDAYHNARSTWSAIAISSFGEEFVGDNKQNWTNLCAHWKAMWL